MDHTPPDSDADAPKPQRSAGKEMTIAALVVSVFLFAGKVAGYVRDMIISGYFGSGAASDAFYLVYHTIITEIYVKIEKLLRPTYLPQFVKKLEEDEEGAWRLGSVIANIQFIVILLIVILLEVFAKGIISRLWPNLAANAGNLHMAATLLRIMAPALLLFSLSVMPELTLHSYKRFTAPAVADCAGRIGMVVVLFVALEYFFHPDNPNAIYAAGLGVLIGYPLRFLVQLPALLSKLKKYVLSLDINTPGVKTVAALMPPVVVGIVFSLARSFADSIFADRVGEGAFTCLKFGRKMAAAPLQILPLAVSFVVYPYLSQWAAQGAKDRLADALVSMTRAMAFVFVPATVAIMLLSSIIISVMFEHGQFGPESTRLAAIALFCYALGIMAFSVEGSINKWYFALEDTATPNYVGAAMAVLHIIIGYVGVFIISRDSSGVTDLGTFGVGIAAIALALTVSKTAKVIILYAMLRSRIGPIEPARIYPFLGKLAFSTAIMGVIMWAILGLLQEPLMAWEPPFGGKKVQMLLLFAVVGGAGTIAYLAAAAGTGIEEFHAVWSHLMGKVKKRLGR